MRINNLKLIEKLTINSNMVLFCGFCGSELEEDNKKCLCYNCLKSLNDDDKKGA